MFCTLGPVRVLLVTHGYPPRYNAGSCVGGYEVHVFARHEDPFVLAYEVGDTMETDVARVRLRVVNNPESRDRYRHAEINAPMWCM